MHNITIIKVVLTSSLVASVFSAIVSAIVTIKLKQLDFKNEYYKKVLDKRMAAYGYIEAQIAVLKSSVLDEFDRKFYHNIFSYNYDDFLSFQQNLYIAMSYGMWFNEETLKNMENLNNKFFEITNQASNDSANLIPLGKKYYPIIVELRNKLEYSVRNDLLALYDLRKLNKGNKKKKTGNRLIKFR